VVVLEAAAEAPWLTFALAALNAMQTILLAYLAADRASVRAMRARGQGSRAADLPPK
jgi:hypothetical protein